MGSDQFAEDFQAASSDASEQKQNLFSNREKYFQEDDLDELKDAITVNIPESCKERKCRACFRRFMFEETYKEFIETCIEYKFLTTIEEINRLLDIRRGKAISPHEFNGEVVKKRVESEGKSSTAEASSGGNGELSVNKLELHAQKIVLGVKLLKVNDGERQIKTNMTDFAFNNAVANNDVLLKKTEKEIESLFATPKPLFP